MDQVANIATRVEPIGLEEAHAVPLADLPKWIRITADQKAAISYEWSVAFGNYKERRGSLALYFHREEHLQITAAEMKADIDPHVIEIGDYSWRMKERIVAFENAERQLLQEFQVKLALARVGSVD